MGTDCRAAAFERDRAGWWIVALNLLAAANSTLYFTTQLRAGLAGWLAMNSCAPSIFVFSLGYVLRQRPLMAAGAGLMFRYGTLGLFVFGWDGMNLIPQVGHILMTVAVIHFIARMGRAGGAADIIAAGLVALALLYSEWQWNWLGARPDILRGLMDGNLAPEMFR
ncbi:MAG: hypothetical protein PHN82_02875 [bacterium]|nr:hypothetical protein [bacterium]